MAILLYYWKGQPNFGDAISGYIVSSISKRKVKWIDFRRTFRFVYDKFLYDLRKIKRFKLFRTFKHLFFGGRVVWPHQRVFFSVGSILDFADKHTVVWGSGYREPYSTSYPEYVYSIRGKLSLSLLPKTLQDHYIAIGDPAFLLPLLYSPCVIKSKKLVIVPHFTDYEFFRTRYGDKYTVVNVRSTDVEGIIDIILSAEYVLSSSLHGLIVSHAYGVPALWVKHNYVQSSDFKYLDYFSSVDIRCKKGMVDFDECLRDDDSIDKLFNGHVEYSTVRQSKIREIQYELLRSFPYKIKDSFYDIISPMMCIH